MFSDRDSDGTSIDLAISLETKARRIREFILKDYKGEDTTEILTKLKDISDYINMVTGVKEYRDSEEGSILKQKDAEFETICAIMEKNGFQNPEQMTTYKFMHRLIILEKQNKKK
ncbi:hypothetical protein EP331_00205 [bacterium]|nr:MAG: hypothetical protein EP331_00205 [bacterium]